MYTYRCSRNLTRIAVLAKVERPILQEHEESGDPVSPTSFTIRHTSGESCLEVHPLSYLQGPPILVSQAPTTFSSCKSIGRGFVPVATGNCAENYRRGSDRSISLSSHARFITSRTVHRYPRQDPHSSRLSLFHRRDHPRRGVYSEYPPGGSCWGSPRAVVCESFDSPSKTVNGILGMTNEQSDFPGKLLRALLKLNNTNTRFDICSLYILSSHQARHVSNACDYWCPRSCRSDRCMACHTT